MMKSAFFRLPFWARIALLVAGSRLWAWLFLVAGTYFPKPADWFWHGQTGSLFWRQVPVRLLDVWGRWDTDFYVEIATGGYVGPNPDGSWVYVAAYFPLLPSLMRGVSELLGGLDVYYAGILVANVLLVLAVVYLVKLARLDHSERTVEIIVACLMAYPGSHFLSCVYPESAALFLGVFAVYCARRRLDVAAGLACALAAVTRSSGGLVCIAVLYELCRREDGRLRPSWRAWVLLLPLLTVVPYLALHWQLYGDPLYFVHVQAGWTRKPAFFLSSLLASQQSLDYHLFALGALALVVWGVRRRERAGYLGLAGAAVLLPLSTGILNGIHRYLASNFPLFFILGGGLASRPRWRWAYLIAGGLVLALYSFKWGQGYQPN